MKLCKDCNWFRPRRRATAVRSSDVSRAGHSQPGHRQAETSVSIHVRRHALLPGLGRFLRVGGAALGGG